MTENRNNFFLKVLEFGILPIAVLFVGLIIEYKTGIFQKTVENNDSLSDSVQTTLHKQDILKLVDSVQSNIFENGYVLMNQKEIYNFKTEIRVYNDIIKDEILTSHKIKGGRVYKTNDTVLRKKIGTQLVEFSSTAHNLYNEIVAIKNNKFYRMRTMYDDSHSSINLTVLENINKEFPTEQVLIKIDNGNNYCSLLGFLHINQKVKYLKSQKKILEDYTDLMLIWKEILN
jgi:hypothetical protein